GLLADDHGGWTYHTVLAAAPSPIPAAPVSEETSEVSWVPVDEVGRMPLHPGFEAQWPALRSALNPVTVVVDIANVMGSRPDGWWRDRAGAAARLLAQIADLAMTGVVALPDDLAAPALERWFPRFVVVLEGVAARGVEDGPDTSAAGGEELPVVVVRAPGSGDDEIVRQTAAHSVHGPTLVITADRELRSRCAAVEAAVTGPRWLLDRL
ncbi:MAG TPA: NUDIX hydrolase, partial [Streptosporangiaceae bacterium]